VSPRIFIIQMPTYKTCGEPLMRMQVLLCSVNVYYLGSSRKSVGKLMSIGRYRMASDKGKRAFL
jgi:hypothetical protein